MLIWHCLLCMPADLEYVSTNVSLVDVKRWKYNGTMQTITHSRLCLESGTSPSFFWTTSLMGQREILLVWLKSLKWNLRLIVRIQTNEFFLQCFVRIFLSFLTCIVVDMWYEGQGEVKHDSKHVDDVCGWISVSCRSYVVINTSIKEAACVCTILCILSILYVIKAAYITKKKKKKIPTTSLGSNLHSIDLETYNGVFCWVVLWHTQKKGWG